MSAKGKGKKAVVNYTKIDGLAVRKFEGDGKWGIYDTFAKKFVSAPRKDKSRVEAELGCRRHNICRPVIVRWIYGCRITDSAKYGVTNLTYGEFLGRS